MNLGLTFDDLARVTGGTLLSGPGGAPAASLAIDSRAVRPGDVFVALKGERSDGHDFVKDVLGRGAAGAVVTRPLGGLSPAWPVVRVDDPVKALQAVARDHRSRSNARVVGVTGSNGKTTTKEMISQVLAAGGMKVLSTKGNLNSRIGLPLMVMELTPAHTHAVFEMGASERGDIAALAAVAKPDAGVITNVGRAHLEYFGSIDGVADAKWELIEALPKGGTAFLNAEDGRLAARRDRARCRVVTFGTSASADVRALDVRQTPEAVFELVALGLRRTVKLPVGGLFNVENALAAAAVALDEGVALGAVVRGLETFVPAAQRMQIHRGKKGAVFVADAYNANPDSMAASLRSFAGGHPGRRRVAVLGSMRELGPHAEAEHRALGALADRLDLARVFFLGPEGAWVRSGGARVECFDDRDALRAAVERELSPEAVVLFKASRGVKMEEIYEPLLE